MEEKKQLLRNKKALLINLGCKVNKYETDAMAERLREAGMEIVEPDVPADVCIVNTCSVTNMAEKKSRQMLSRVRRQNEKAVVIAAGCYVNAEHEKLLKNEHVDIVVGNNRKKEIVEVLEDYYLEHTGKCAEGQAGEHTEEHVHMDCYAPIGGQKEYEEIGNLRAEGLDHRRAYIKIQDGCNQFCSYCIIPYTRGRVRSREPEEIIREISRLAASGVKEFVLTGIHISSYGTDFSEEKEPNDLGSLVRAIDGIPEVKRIRLGSLEPRIITEEFLSKIKDSEKLCPHFHLSLQSACNATLKRMNRRYTIEEYMDKCRLLRECFDRPAITTDVIVGFPGETEEEFDETFANLKRLGLYEIHVFKYSLRSKTAAEKLPDHVSEEIKNIRSNLLLELTEKQKADFEGKLSGMVDEVLVEEPLDCNGEGEKLAEAEILSKSGLPENIPEDGQYFTGHTKRYVKVRVKSNQDLVNRLLAVKMS